jgi:hypothetical protein
MRHTSLVLLACLLPGVLAGQQSDPQRDLLDRLVGHWVLRGTIAGQQTTHDVDAQWVLEKGYVQIHEVSREKDASGKPEYEALVHIVWDPQVGEYACLWLDTTGVAAFPPEGIGRAKPAGDRIAFVFGDAGDRIHNTFTYDRAAEAWAWAIDNESNGVRTPFARVTLTRR